MTRRYKVIRIIARLNVGGPAIQACSLTTRLDAERYECKLIAGQEGPAEGDFLALHGIQVASLERVPQLGRELRTGQDLTALVRLVRLLARERPDVVHTHTAKAGTLGRLAARMTRVPVIVHTFHGHVLDGYFSRRREGAFVAIERALARITTRLIAVTPTVRDELLARGIGKAERFSVVRLGLDLQPFLHADEHRGALRRELRLDEATPLVGIVGRLVPIKAHELFLAAARSVAAASPAHFVVVGDGELRVTLEATADALGLGNRVHFLGWRADLPSIYADLDVVVSSSRNEGSPVALIEAMAAARPVVATRVGGVADVVLEGRTGLLVPPHEAPALSGAILALLVDAERRGSLGRAGRAAVHPAYSVERLLGDIDSLYTDALASAGCRA